MCLVKLSDSMSNVGSGMKQPIDVIVRRGNQSLAPVDLLEDETMSEPANTNGM